ncbi:hypothetical protein CEXT_99491 [Caerostris extrusa]|uniref:Uncharacterized protein n=1 Tax=Caerostris extrusa TaxID=172846 RepID=A0AAV4XJ85_CAEEX|nr:hypothetical protein CEXT_99491 [Caerostris extrusa]
MTKSFMCHHASHRTITNGNEGTCPMLCLSSVAPPRFTQSFRVFIVSTQARKKTKTTFPKQIERRCFSVWFCGCCNFCDLLSHSRASHKIGVLGSAEKASIIQSTQEDDLRLHTQPLGHQLDSQNAGNWSLAVEERPDKDSAKNGRAIGHCSQDWEKFKFMVRLRNQEAFFYFLFLDHVLSYAAIWNGQ